MTQNCCASAPAPRKTTAERRADLRAAIELARKQCAVIFELRSAAEYFELYGERQPLADAITDFPGSSWPELSRALAVLDA